MQPERGIEAPGYFPTHHFPSQHKVCETLSQRKSRTRLSKDDGELQKNITYASGHGVEYVLLAPNQSFRAEGEQIVDLQSPGNTSQALQRRSDPAKEGSEGNRFPEERFGGIRSQVQASAQKGVDIQSRDIQSSVDKRLGLFTSPCADNQTKSSPSLRRGTLEISRVQSGDKIAVLGSSYTSLRVSKYDQQGQTDAVEVHGERVHRYNIFEIQRCNPSADRRVFYSYILVYPVVGV